jgi:hypothetical protein
MMILRNGKFSGKILRKIFRTGKFSMENFPPHITSRAMAQVISRRPLTAEALVRIRVNTCGICGGQSGTGTGFSQSSSIFQSIYHSTVALQIHIIWGMRNMPM